jgi:hypothetical protein
MSNFVEEYEKWIQDNITNETNPRRRELLEKGLGHGSIEFLRLIWFPTIGNFDHLYPEWEVRDFNNGYRYLDFAYMPRGVKGCIEIQGYGPHARDLDVRRFIDLCKRDCFLAIDGWTIFPIAYLSIRDEPKQCIQIILSIIGKYISMDVPSDLTCLEAETVRFSRRRLRPITPLELSEHLRISDRHARRVLQKLVDLQLFKVASGTKRGRSYVLKH